MGLLFGEATFDGPPPDLERIVEKMAEISGLQASVQDVGVDDEGELVEMRAELAFACAPEERIVVFTYRAGAAKKRCHEALGGQPLPTAEVVEGYHVTDETHLVHLERHVCQDPTLWAVTLLALEALGGRLKEPIPEEFRREYGQPVTPAELARRRRKAHRRLCMATAITIPLCLLSLLWFIVTVPWRIWRAYKLCRDPGRLPSDSD